ncbi:Nucleotidyl transferase [uncultured Gammaproteobacteria bacterium]
MQCVILAGGLGVRLRPITERIPKALVEVAGHPFADHQLAWLSAQRIDRVTYCIGYLGKLIQDFVGDGGRWGLNVSYASEGDHLLGTAGALRLALDAGLLDEAFFILYGDSYLPIPFAPVWQAAQDGPGALMTVFHNQGRWDQSNVIFKDGWVNLYEKGRRGESAREMTHIDYGLSVLSRKEVEDAVPSGQILDLADVFHRLSLAGRLKGFEVTERFFEVGSSVGIQDLEDYLAASKTAP